jgi:AcrR family transcriptional regulator
MPARRRAQISTRKQPQQARSTELVEAILQAAVRVLEKEGAQRFTTARVAEKAGVSVGSVYQYFPNKASILFRLQSDEWRQTTDMMRAILEDRARPPLERLRSLVRHFVQSECEEATIRGALDDAAPLYRDAPEAIAAKGEWDSVTDAFMREVLPGRPKPVRDLAGDLITTTLSAVGKEFSETRPTLEEARVYSDAMADMFCGYLKSLGAR